jgi:2-polyprenyl-3-methyl-5-hydroxy-6-metoxy-1,4-benzoquinol methylase
VNATRSSGFSTDTYQVSTVSFDRELVEERGIWAPDDLIVISYCPLCSSADFRQVATRQDGLPIQECNLCGLAFVDPRPSSARLADYYGKGYFTGEKDFFKDKDYCLERDKSLAARAITGYQEIISHFDVRDKVILDIGCASGALLCLLREQGAREVVGLDHAEYPVAFGRERYDLDLRCKTLESASLPDGYFDLVTLIDVIEHVEDLNVFVTELRRVLKPDGNVFLSTPNYLAHTLAKEEWSCLYQDFEHLQYFSRHSLGALARTKGFQVLNAWTNTLPFRVYEYPGHYRHRIYHLFHPAIAMRNTWKKLKFKTVGKSSLSVGLSLNAVLSPV